MCLVPLPSRSLPLPRDRRYLYCPKIFFHSREPASPPLFGGPGTVQEPETWVGWLHGWTLVLGTRRIASSHFPMSEELAL